ncbi:MAG: hypothetical protein AABY22_34895, partial [Nanoarchaeota archaeon]
MVLPFVKKRGGFGQWLLIGGAVYVGLSLMSPAFNADWGFSKLASSIGTTQGASIGGAVPPGSLPTVLVDDNQGDSATVTFKAYDREAPTLREVGAPISIFTKDGVKIKDLASFDTIKNTLTNVAVGDFISFAGGNSTAGTTLYVDAMGVNPDGTLGNLVAIDKVQKNIDVDAHNITAEIKAQIIIYDDTGSNELTKPVANLTVTNRIDYNRSIGSSETQILYVKAQNKQAYSLWKIGAVCVAYKDNMKDFKPSESGWTKTFVPQGLSTGVTYFTNFSASAVGGGSTPTSEKSTGEYDACYKLDVPVELHDYDSKTWKFVAESKSTDPVGS